MKKMFEYFRRRESYLSIGLAKNQEMEFLIGKIPWITSTAENMKINDDFFFQFSIF